MINYRVGMRVQIKIPRFPSICDLLHEHGMGIYNELKPFHDCYGKITAVYHEMCGYSRICCVNVMLDSDTDTTVLRHIPCEYVVPVNDESSNELCGLRSKTEYFDEYVNYRVRSYIQDCEVSSKYKPVRVIYHDPATIVFWSDGSKTVVKRSSKEKFNKYTAFCAALAKKIYGNNSRVNKIVNSGEDSLQNTGKKKEKKENKHD